MEKIVSTFHPKLQTIIKSACPAFRVPAQVPVAATLATLATGIGRSRVLKVVEGWVEPASLSTAVVGASGSGKSPCEKAFLKRFFDLNAVEHLKWKEATSRWKKALRDGDADPENPPRCKQFVLDVASLQALAGVLEANPRGVLIYNDELANLLGRVSNSRGSTSELRRRVIENDGSLTWTINRVDPKQNTQARYATLSVFGNIQPALLPETFGAMDLESGLLPRFIFILVPQISPIPLTRQGFTHGAELESIIDSLLAFDLGDDGQSGIIEMTEEAFDLFKQWDMMVRTESTWDAAKLGLQALRICLMLHCSDAVCEGRSEMAPVTPDTMDRAIELANWLGAQRQQVAEYIRTIPTNRNANEVTRDTIRAILELCPQDREAVVPTQDVHAKLTSWGHVVTLHGIGRLCGSLGLEKAESSAQSRWRISLDKLAIWRKVTGQGILGQAV